MAFRLEKEKTASMPYVLVDEEKNNMKLEGRCFHENIGLLFNEINQWLDVYLETDFEVFTFDNEISYYNSSTTKIIYNMLMKLDKYAGSGKKIVVNWITTEDNEVMIECGEDFMEDIENLTFNLIVN